MTLAQKRYDSMNSTIRSRLDSCGTLVMAHRGTASPVVVENTLQAAQGAILSGSDIVELDVSASTDGRYFAFHDGNEQRLLGTDANLTTLTGNEIQTLRYIHVSPPERPTRIQPVGKLVEGLWDVFPDALVNIDRSWSAWPGLLTELDKASRPDQIILKAPVLVEYLQELQDHRVKYAFVGICHDGHEVETLFGAPDVNVLGAELIAQTPTSEFLSQHVLNSYHERGALLVANAEVMTDDSPLFAGHDDNQALFGKAGQGWNALLDFGFDVIQTDWPWLLRQLINSRGPGCQQHRHEFGS